jgi:hypothetical protein
VELSLSVRGTTPGVAGVAIDFSKSLIAVFEATGADIDPLL